VTQALDAFLLNGNDVTALLDLHTEKGGDAFGRRWGLEVLNKSAVVLICSYWEAYCEDLAAEALRHLVMHTTDPSRLPVRLRRKVAEELKADLHELAVWNVAGDGWRNALAARLADFQADRNRELNTPKSGPVDDLFDHTLGLERVSDSWRWQRSSAARSRKRLDEYVSLRGDIAHRGQAAESVRKVQVVGFSDHTRRLVWATEARVIEWVAESTGEPLSGPPPPIVPPVKRCPRCGEEKEHQHFGKRSASEDGLYPICRACLAAARR
jgi:hypothetical protein